MRRPRRRERAKIRCPDMLASQVVPVLAHCLEDVAIRRPRVPTRLAPSERGVPSRPRFDMTVGHHRLSERPSWSMREVATSRHDRVGRRRFAPFRPFLFIFDHDEPVGVAARAIPILERGRLHELRATLSGWRAPESLLMFTRCGLPARNVTFDAELVEHMGGRDTRRVRRIADHRATPSSESVWGR